MRRTGCPDLHSYRIRYRKKGTSSWNFADASSQSGNQNYGGHITSATIPDQETFTMEDSTTYEVGLRAGRWDNAWNGWGEWSDTTEANTSPFPAAKVEDIEATTATLHITNHTGDWYHKHTTPSNGTCSSKVSSGTSKSDLTVSANTNYTYAAYSDSGCAFLLATASSFLTKPAQPGKPTVTAGAGSGKLAITASVTGGGTISKWQYKQKEGSNNFDQDWSDFSNSGSTSLNHTFTGLTDGTSYQYKVRAVNASGESAASDASDAVQLMAMRNRENVDRFVAKHNLQNVLHARIARNGQILHVLILGVYPNLDSARKAVSALPPALRDITPWVRSVGSVHGAMQEKG